jgi:hypothetical protein
MNTQERLNSKNDSITGKIDTTVGVILSRNHNVPRLIPQRQIIQGEHNMAEVDTTQLSQEHGAIRHDIAVESARLGNQIGAGACAITKHIGDMRQEDAENFGHTRRDIQGTSADIRREQAVGFGDTRYNIAERTGDIRREVAQGFDKTGDTIMQEGQEGIMATKDARYDLSSRITNSTDRVSDRVMELRGLVGERFYTVGRDLADLRQGQATLSKDVELNALKTQLDAAKNTQYLADKIAVDGDKTRSLINDLKYHDLNRGLVERNTEIVNCEQDRRHYRDRWQDSRWDQVQTQFAGQWAQLQNQVQAFQSQLQETRQGMVNFGTMAGVGQTSTSNNVR